MHIHEYRDCFCNLLNQSYEGYKNLLFILSLLICIDQWIRVQVAFIKGVQQDFDISIDARAHIFLPEAFEKPDNQRYQQ